MNATRKPNGRIRLVLAIIAAMCGAVTILWQAFALGDRAFYSQKCGAVLETRAMATEHHLDTHDTTIGTMTETLTAIRINQEVMMRAQGLRPVPPSALPGDLP